MLFGEVFLFLARHFVNICDNVLVCSFSNESNKYL